VNLLPSIGLRTAVDLCRERTFLNNFGHDESSTSDSGRASIIGSDLKTFSHRPLTEDLSGSRGFETLDAMQFANQHA
jgi:hypothetical protein